MQPDSPQKRRVPSWLATAGRHVGSIAKSALIGALVKRLTDLLASL
jgi:hypothetical protein